MPAESLIATYPRTRPALPHANNRVYVSEYQKTRGENKHKPLMSKLSSYVSGWMHRKVSQFAKPSGAVLEIGAGTLNHLPHEKTHAAYDIVEPFKALYEKNPALSQIRSVYEDIRQIKVVQYDRIVSVAALEHLTELPYALAKSGLLLKQGGVFQAGIPAEGGLLWGAAWRLSTGLAYRLHNGISYRPVMRHEHINSASEIIELTQYFFNDVSLAYFPLPAIHASLFIAITARGPNLERCNQLAA